MREKPWNVWSTPTREIVRRRPSVLARQQGTHMEWRRVEFSREEEPPRDVKVGGNISLRVAFGETGLDAGDFPHVASTTPSATTPSNSACQLSNHYRSASP